MLTAPQIVFVYSIRPEDIVAFGERSTLKKAITSSQALYKFFTLLEVQLKRRRRLQPLEPSRGIRFR